MTTLKKSKRDEVTRFNIVQAQVKGVDTGARSVRGPLAKSVRVAYVDWRGKRTCHMYRVFPYRVYIDSNRRDSRIGVTACLVVVFT
jgi:hypothetical protein